MAGDGVCVERFLPLVAVGDQAVPRLLASRLAGCPVRAMLQAVVSLARTVEAARLFERRQEESQARREKAELSRRVRTLQRNRYVEAERVSFSEEEAGGGGEKGGEEF